jgi:hypothetical protein
MLRHFLVHSIHTGSKVYTLSWLMEMLGSLLQDEGLRRCGETLYFRVAVECVDLYLLSSIRFYGALSSLANIGVKPVALQYIVGQVFVAF